MSGKNAFEVGNCKRVNFWKDKCSNEIFCVSFPSFFSFASSKEVLVANVQDSTIEAVRWNYLFSRSFNDWELYIREGFISKIH